MTNTMDAYQQYIHKSRYSRWLEDQKRREDWPETVQRYIDFFDNRTNKEHTKLLNGRIKEAILNLEVMPSMRAMMSAGPALERENLAGFNCSYLAVDNIEAFSETLYILMCGTGVGFSCERQEINKLPEVPEEIEVIDGRIVVGDSKRGWSEAFATHLDNLYKGHLKSVDYSQVRPSGERLKVFGGRASGPKPLEKLMNFTTNMFMKAKGRKLESLEVHDLMCMIGEIVVVGGVRRCLPAGSKIQLTSGFKNIEDIKPGDIVETKGQQAEVIAKVYSGKQKILNIQHQFGVLKCTENHRVLVFHTKDSHKYVQAKNLTTKDTLVWDSFGYSGEQQSLPEILISLHPNNKKVKFPKVLTEDLSWLIGLIHGDGYVGERNIEITSATHEKQLLIKANNIVRELFGVESKISDGNGDCLRLRINSSNLTKWFKEHIKKPKDNIRIPDFIKKSEVNTRHAYLAGLFDADGRTRVDGVIDQLTTIYKSFSDDVQDLLTGLGLSHSEYFVNKEKLPNSIDAYTVKLTGITSRSFWLDNIEPYSSSGKASEVKIKIGSGHDFRYHKELLDSPRGWKNNVTLTTAKSKGFVSLDTKLYPTQIKSITTDEIKQETFDIEVKDLHCFTTEGLVVHNSALISLSNLSDQRMRDAKAGNWFERNAHRGLANNSVAYTEKPSADIFLEEWTALVKSGSGERGIFNRAAAGKQAAKWGRRAEDLNYGTNPCSEIILRNKQLCNLSEVVVREDDDFESLKDKVELATILGTFQATLDKFNFVSDKWRQNTAEEALLGVSMTGIMDNKLTSGSSGSINLTSSLIDLRKHAREINAKWARKLGINESASITCVKPSGTVSQLCNSASGIHTRHHHQYIRTVRVDKKDPLYQFMIDQGVPTEDEQYRPETTAVVSFAIEAPQNSTVRTDQTAIEALELWLIYQRHWCEHKPSVTITVKDSEWLAVGAWVYDHFDEVSGISFLPHTDHTYPQAPYQDLTPEEYQEWISENPMPEIDWSKLSNYEKEDNTVSSQELACAAGGCEIV